MEYRKTRDGLLEVSAVGMGTYAYSGVYGRKDPGAMKQVMRAAYDRGVTMFDTAPTYGEAEAAVGEVLRDVRAHVVISTKVPAEVEGLSCSYESITGACETSLKRIGTDYIDLYQIHFDDGVSPVEEVIKAFEDLRASGKIRAYGIGHVSRDRAGEYVYKGSPSTVMGELSAVSRNYYLDMLPLLRESEVGYIGFSLSGRGMLTGAMVERENLTPGDIRQMDAVFAGEKRKSGLRIREEFRSVGSDLGATTAAVAIAWAMSREGLLTGLIGPSSLEHLEEDLRGADLQLDESARNRLDDFLNQEGARLAKDLNAEVLSILDRHVTDTERGASDLIYAMEGLADLDLVRQEDLVSSMGKVIKIMKSGEGGLSALDAIRRDLLSHVSSS